MDEDENKRRCPYGNGDDCDEENLCEQCEGDRIEDGLRDKADRDNDQAWEDAHL